MKMSVYRLPHKMFNNKICNTYNKIIMMNKNNSSRQREYGLAVQCLYNNQAVVVYLPGNISHAVASHTLIHTIIAQIRLLGNTTQ